MAKAKIIARKASDKNYFNISIQVRHGEQRKMQKLGIRVHKDHWDAQRFLVKDQHQQAFSLNSKITLYEQAFYKAFRKVNKSYHNEDDVSFDKIVEEWLKMCSEDESVEQGEDIVREYEEYVVQEKTVATGLHYTTVDTYHRTVLYLKGYVFERGGRMSVAEFAQDKEFLRFGTWLKEAQKIQTPEGVVEKPPQAPSTVKNYLFKFNDFFLERKKAGQLDNFISAKKINSTFKNVKDVLRYVLPEDMVEAIMQTEIDFMVHGKKNANMFNERCLLDSLKLIIGHGFRYSDLVSMSPNNILKEVDENGVEREYFVYDSPKSGTPSVKIPFYPNTRELLDFWKDREDRQYKLNKVRLSKNMLDTICGVNFYLKHTQCGRRGTNPVREMAIHRNPLIAYSPYIISKSYIRERLYKKIQVTWLINKFGSDWHKHQRDEIGFMKPVQVIDGRGIRTEKFYETLSYHFGRHTFISRALNVFGLPAPYVQKLVGHADLATTLQYVRTDEDDIMKRLNAAYDTRTNPQSQLRKAM